VGQHQVKKVRGRLISNAKKWERKMGEERESDQAQLVLKKRQKGGGALAGPTPAPKGGRSSPGIKLGKDLRYFWRKAGGARSPNRFAVRGEEILKWSLGGLLGRASRGDRPPVGKKTHGEERRQCKKEEKNGSRTLKGVVGGERFVFFKKGITKNSDVK